MSKNILLTGSTGFVGSRFLERDEGKYQIQTVAWQELGKDSLDLKGVEVVLHMAALNHRMDLVPDEDYHRSNFELSKNLGEQAQAEGVRHFIFLSTVKVYGQKSNGGRAYTESDACEPIDAYGKSKLNAEKALQILESDSFKVSIVRCPLVYGPNVKGNMQRLIKLADSGYPLGFEGIDNKRTMVFVD
ncbi:MAG: NAD-dependent epimerase/dehydratase family protein, partial [Flavobacteriales bacterium]|nr:NAD-dependent epimerase/dehydratase family protein [Flavobacteriales bacterium]